MKFARTCKIDVQDNLRINIEGEKLDTNTVAPHGVVHVDEQNNHSYAKIKNKYNTIRRVLLYTTNIVKLMGPTGATKQLA